MALMEAFAPVAQTNTDDLLTIGGKTFRSRLMLGTGKYRNAEEMNAALEASGCEIVTVALRRIDLDKPTRSILDEIDWKRYHILPNTAGARTADEAVRTARLARAMGLSDWIKVEVIPDPKYLLPDPIGTFDACKTLVAEGFIVLPYINADPALALRLQEIGTHTVMPLASPIGSGQGVKTREQIQIIIEQATVPVVVDAGIGVPSEAAQAMELGASACLINTAIARALRPGRDGLGNANGGGRGPQSLSRRPNARPALCQRQQPAGRHRAVTRLPLPCLMLVTEPSPRLPEIIAEAVAGGVNVVQWRDKTAEAEQMQLRQEFPLIRAASGSALLVVNGPRVLNDTDGKHLPSDGAPIEFFRKWVPGLLLGRSVHSIDEAEQAEAKGADYLAAGTIFASQSHPEIEPAGLDFLREVCAAVSIPVLAIGGVTPENAGDCIQAGAVGVAVLSPIMRAEDPKAAAQAYRAVLDGAWEKKQCS